MTEPWEMMTMREHVDCISEGGNKTLTWRGCTCWKNPLDLMIYQEIVMEVGPGLVIETGTHQGGSALFWADMLALRGGGMVISIDVVEPPFKPPKVIQFLTGSSTDPAIVEQITPGARRIAEAGSPVIVNLDSDHAYRHVTDELNAYSDLVTPGSYLIVEDGIDDHRWNRQGPHAATLDWLRDHPEFEIDKRRERLGLTNCPDGFLRRR